MLLPPDPRVAAHEMHLVATNAVHVHDAEVVAALGMAAVARFLCSEMPKAHVSSRFHMNTPCG